MQFNIFRRSRKVETNLSLVFWGWRRTPCSGWTRRQRRSWRPGHWLLSSDGPPPPMYSPSTLETTKTNTTVCRQPRGSISALWSPATLTLSWSGGRGKRDLARTGTRRRRWRSRSSAPDGQLRFMVCLKLWKKLSPIHWLTPASSETQDVSTFFLVYLINSLYLFLQLISRLFLYFIIFPAQEINFNGHSSSQKSIVTNGHQNGGFDAGVWQLVFLCFPSLHVLSVYQKYCSLTISSFCDLTTISSSYCSSSLERAYHSMYLVCLAFRLTVLLLWKIYAFWLI